MLGPAPVTAPSSSTPEEWAAEVIRANGVDLLAYLARRTSSSDDAPDVLGDVLVVIWRRRGSIPHDPSQARMWSFGVARNALRDYRRHGARRSQLAETLRASLITSATEGEGDPAEIAARAARASEVRAAVAALPDRDRELIVLIHWDGFSISEAAALLRLNASTTRTRYARARARLATHLEAHRTISSPDIAGCETRR